MPTFEVKNLSCGHCVKAVTRAIQSVDAQAAVEVDLGRQQVAVTSTAPEARLREALAAADYPAS